MFFDLALTAGGILPFYVILIGIMTKEYDQRFAKLFRIFVLSGITTIPFFALRWMGWGGDALASLFGPLYSIIALAFAEEFVKSVALLFDRELSRHYYYPIIVGLSFAFFENISYLFGFEFTVSFLTLAVIRLFMGSTAHAVFTTLVAHILNKASKKMRMLYYLLGLLVAGSFHSLFNLLHAWKLSYFAVPLLILLIVYLHYDRTTAQKTSSIQLFSGRTAH